MNNKIIQIKQAVNSFAKSLKQDADFTTHPNSFRLYYPRKNKVTKDWITGLTEKEVVDYGLKLKKDLSANSDFWEGFQIRLVNRTGVISFNLNNPLEYIQYKCAIANKFIASSKEELKESDYYINDTFLYVYDPENELRKENSLRELKDECTSLIFQMKTQKEKQFYILAKTGTIVNESWSEGILYKNLSIYLEGLKKEESLIKFLELLKTDNFTLQLDYIVNKAFSKQITNINGQWTFGGNSLGSTKEQVLKTLTEKSDLMTLLLEEVGTIL